MVSDINIGTPYLPINNTIGPGPTGAPKGPPIGFKALTVVNPEIGSVAKNLLGNNFGTLIPFSLNGKQYMARVEPHYHPPGFKSGPNGWHKGITVYEKSDGKSETKSTNPIKPKTVDRKKLLEDIDKFLDNFGGF